MNNRIFASFFGVLCLTAFGSAATWAQAVAPDAGAPSQKGAAPEAKPGKAEPKEERIDAERPGFTNGTATVPVGHLQFETGYLYTRSDAGVHEHRIGDAAVLRVPTGATTEFRLGLPVYSFTHVPETASGSGVQSPTSGAGGGGGGGENTHGFGDTTIGEKWRFLNEDEKRTHPSLALTVQTTLPTGEPAYHESHLQPQIELDANYEFAASWDVQSVLFYARPADEGRQFSQWAGGLNVQHDLTETTGVFLETYRISPTGKDAPNGNYVDTGITHLLGNNTQVDFNLGTGINSAIKHDQFIGFGVAHRW